MNKWFVLACLCGCAFADWVQNQPLSCPYHVKVNADVIGGEVEMYGIQNENSVPLFVKYDALDAGISVYLRCDIKNDEGLCLQHTYQYSGGTSTCSDSYVSASSGVFPFYMDEFQYDESRYPQKTTCADGSDCELYCDADDDECVVVNAEGYFVMTPSFNWTFYEPPSMDVFEFDKCDASDPHRHLDAPVNSCEKYGDFLPTPIDCQYHVRVVGEYNPFNRDEEHVVDFYGVKVGDVPIYAKVVSGTDTDLVRCDITNENGDCYLVSDSNGLCSEKHISPSTVKNEFMPYIYSSYFVYDSANYPKPVQCPDDSTGCKLYCKDILEESCVIVDPAGHVVSNGNSNYTFFEPPSIDEFDGSDCKSVPLPTSVDYCAMVGTISPTFPECSFRIRMDGILRLQRSTNSFTDYYFIKVNNDVEALKIVYDVNEWYLYRFDLCSNGNCYARYEYPGACNEDIIPYAMKFAIPFLPQPIQYNISKYPVDFKCPDETDGCKLYCDFDSICVVVDSNGYFVSTTLLGNLTYYGDIPFDVFETVRCDNITRVPAPSTDVCPHSSSTTPSSTTSTTSASSTTSSIAPTSQPSINPSLSSAPVVKAVISVVAIAIAVALL